MGAREASPQVIGATAPDRRECELTSRGHVLWPLDASNSEEETAVRELGSGDHDTCSGWPAGSACYISDGECSPDRTMTNPLISTKRGGCGWIIEDGPMGIQHTGNGGANCAGGSGTIVVS